MKRSQALRNLIVLPALAGLAVTATAQAADSRVTLKYQDKPNGKQQCSGCALFVPGKTPTATGGCKIIKGAISPHGWCTAFSPKG